MASREAKRKEAEKKGRVQKVRSERSARGAVVIPATPRRPSTPEFSTPEIVMALSSDDDTIQLGDEDVIMLERNRAREGLEASKFAPLVQEEEEGSNQAEDIEHNREEEDEDEDMGEEIQPVKKINPDMEPEKAWAYVEVMFSLFMLFDEEQEANKGKKRKGGGTALGEAIWNIGRQVDKGKGWKVIVEEECEGGLGHKRNTADMWKRWVDFKDASMDRRESSTSRMAAELEAMQRQMAIVMDTLGAANASQKAIAKKEKRKAEEDRNKKEEEEVQRRKVASLEKRQAAEEVERLRSEMNISAATRAEEIRAEQERQAKIREIELKLEYDEANLKVLKAKEEGERLAAEDKVKKAKEKVEQERRRIEAAARATIPSSGARWMVAGGKKMKRMTASVLIKQRYTSMNDLIRARWDEVIRITNNLVVEVENKRETPLFRVGHMATNVAVSRYERRIEIIEARWDITDEEVLEILSPQLEVILGEDFIRCWIEGSSTITLVARGVPICKELDSGDKLGKAMREYNPAIMLGFRDPVRLGGLAWGGVVAKATVVKFEVYEFADALKLVKDGIFIEGKVRAVEEFKGQPQTVFRQPERQRLLTEAYQPDLQQHLQQQGPRTPQSPGAPQSPMTPQQLKALAFSSGYRRYDGRCMRCPLYRNGGLAHEADACPLKNNPRDERGYIQKRLASYISADSSRAQWP